jgi:acyl dehydratase
MSPIAPMYLEDFVVGQIFHSGSVTVELERIKAFAADFDPQPFHLDEAAAGHTLFGRLVASGWQTAALSMRLMVDSDLKVAGGLIGMGVEAIRWPRPVYPSDLLRVESEVLEVRTSQSKPDQGIVRIRNTTLNQDNQPVMIQTASLLVPRSPAAREDPSQA